MSDEDVGFVLSVVPYREHDAMLEFIGEKYGLLRFVLRGYYRPNSKQTRLGNEFTKVRIRFKYYENRLLTIQNGELLESYAKDRHDFDWLMLMSLMTELIVRLYDPRQKQFWNQKINQLYNNPSMDTITLILRDIIVISGIEPVVDRCVITGSSQVSDFSIKHGGFVSKAYRVSKLNLDDLKSLYGIFKGQDKYTADPLTIANILINYIEFHMDLKLNSWKLIYNV